MNRILDWKYFTRSLVFYSKAEILGCVCNKCISETSIGIWTGMAPPKGLATLSGSFTLVSLSELLITWCDNSNSSGHL